MLIGCPGCKANYVFEDAKITAQGVKLRCYRCQTVFRVVRKRVTPASGVVPVVGERYGKIISLVVAHESPAFCEAVQRVVANESFLVYDSNDGGEAMAIIERVKPDVVLLDVALPTMYGFEICEAMRKDPRLAQTKIILLAAIYDKRRYRRDPASLYGADDVIEKHRIPGELVARIHSLLGTQSQGERSHDTGAEQTVADVDNWLEARSDGQEGSAYAPLAAGDEMASAPGPHEVSADLATAVGSTPAWDGVDLAAPVVGTTSVAPAGDPFTAELTQSFGEAKAASEPTTGIEAIAVTVAEPENLPEDHLKARRLARIIVADIALYNPEKVRQGIMEGNISQLLAEEYAEGEALYAQRVAADIRATTNFLPEAWQQLIARKAAEFGR